MPNPERNYFTDIKQQGAIRYYPFPENTGRYRATADSRMVQFHPGNSLNRCIASRAGNAGFRENCGRDKSGLPVIENRITLA
jgi:hypothetical protein